MNRTLECHCKLQDPLDLENDPFYLSTLSSGVFYSHACLVILACDLFSLLRLPNNQNEIK